MTKKARLRNARKTISSTNGAGKTAQPQIKKMKLDHSLTPCTKISSTWIKYLNVRPDTLKLLEENIGRTLSDINCSNIFFDLFPRIMEMKTKINKWDLLKLKTFTQQGKPLTKTKGQPIGNSLAVQCSHCRGPGFNPWSGN